MPVLQKFLQGELHRRGWSVEEFARRASMSTSNGYLIVRDGKDNVRQNTFAAIAAALGMQPAELARALDDLAPDHVANITAMVRQVPAEQRSLLEDIVRLFAGGVAPTRSIKRARQLDKHNDEGIYQIPRWMRKLAKTPSQQLARSMAPAYLV